MFPVAPAISILCLSDIFNTSIVIAKNLR